MGDESSLGRKHMKVSGYFLQPRDFVQGRLKQRQDHNSPINLSSIIQDPLPVATMPYTFSLPTTSSLAYSHFLQSSSHPSLALTASVHRSVLRDVLKKHKRLSPQAQTANLGHILSALQDYLPYLFALADGLSNHTVCDEEIDVILQKEIEVEWKPSLASTIPGREVPRLRGKGLDYELSFTLATLAYVYNLLARSHLHSIYLATTPLSPDQRVTAITTATKHLLFAVSVHNFLIPRVSEASFPPSAIDISSPTQSALSSLALAEATLLAITKDDPYSALVAQDRNSTDREWMFKAPEIPQVRAHLFARLSLAAAQHSNRAYSLLKVPAGKSNKAKGACDSVVNYARDLAKTSRAKACRFFGIDAELRGKTGEAIAWVNGGLKELDIKPSIVSEASKTKGFSKLKQNWVEKREDKKIEKGGEWGGDAGRLEEGRVLQMLEKKWHKINDMVCSQTFEGNEKLTDGQPDRSTHKLSRLRRP